jgi:hypothetical protein
MPPVIVKPDNFVAATEIINRPTGSELYEATRKIYKIPVSVPFQFWTGTIGMTNRRQWNLKEPIPEDVPTLYVRIVVSSQFAEPVPDERSLVA